MALVLKTLYNGYFWIFDELSDPRSRDMLFSSPFSIAIIMAGYVYTVKVWGPKLMENRQPYNLNNIIKVYDLVQIVLNIYVSFKALHHIAAMKMSCQNVDYSDSPNALDQLYIVRFFFFVKLLDLIETVFFVLRKSYRQVSFLHVYHHTGMVLCTYIGFQFLGGSVSLWLPMLNGFVHVAMFLYYLLSAIDSSWKQSTVFKRTLTQLQLIQFGIFILVFGSVLVRECEYPNFAGYVFVPQNMFMVVLFGDFYVKTYVFSKSKNVKNDK